jgi:hypothetical protein
MLTKKQLKEAAAYWGTIGGKIGGRSTSAAKLAAIAKNGKKGGRPRRKNRKRK